MSSDGLRLTGYRASARHHLGVESSTIAPLCVEDTTEPPRQCHCGDAFTATLRDAGLKQESV
jgi:hypothetical protein